jgi:biotin synthase-like enzyme
LRQEPRKHCASVAGSAHIGHSIRGHARQAGAARGTEQVVAGGCRAQEAILRQQAVLFELPFNDLLFRAQEVHRAHHSPNAVQRSTLLSIKTGGCSEDCGYCSQSARYARTEASSARSCCRSTEVVAAAQAAKDNGRHRFCMGAAWRGPKDRIWTA